MCDALEAAPENWTCGSDVHTRETDDPANACYGWSHDAWRNYIEFLRRMLELDHTLAKEKA